MENFSEYLKKVCNTKENNIRENDNCKSNDNITSNNYNEEELSKLIEMYSKYNSDELMNEFIKLTIEKKKRGELDNATILHLKEMLNPLLSDEQKDTLNKLLELVKDVK